MKTIHITRSAPTFAKVAPLYAVCARPRINQQVGNPGQYHDHDETGT